MWEYQVIVLDHFETTMFIAKESAAIQQKELNKHISEGWEIVSTVAINSIRFIDIIAYLKRQKP